MRALLIVLPEQVRAVVVPVRSPDDRVDVLPIDRPGIGGEAPQPHRQLMIEFDQYHRALDSVIKNAFRLDTADPREAGAFYMPPDFAHIHLRVFLARFPY